MPRVPTYDGFQAAQTTLPQVRFDAPAMPDIAGQQAQQIGAGLQRFGAALGEEAERQNNIADQIAVNDALNQAKEYNLYLTHDKDAGFVNQRGINALKRQSGKALDDEYVETFQQKISAISGSLGNDKQRMLFQQQASGMATSMRGQLLKHQSDEFRSYGLSVSEGVQSTALRDIGLNYRNPEMLDKAILRIEAETYRQAQFMGKSAEWQEAHARKMTSNGFKVAMLSAIEQNDPAYAEAMLKKYSSRMDADDILAVRGHVTKEMNNQVGVSVAGDVMNKLAPKLQPGDAERAFNILLRTESGGKQFNKDGSVVTSVKGAIGIAQVMPTTAPEAAKLAGLPWDESRYKNDPDYNKALGLAYFQKQLQTFSGDVNLAWAAYNAGPGAVQKALKAQEKNAKLAANDPSIARSWLDYLPKETQDYVAKNAKALNSGMGNPPKPTLVDALNEIKSDPRIANNPDRMKVATAAVEHQFTQYEKAIKQREEEIVANAMKLGEQVGWRFSDLPPAIRNAIPPGKQDDVLSYYQKRAKGDDTTSLWLYGQLSGNPQKLAAMTDNQFYALRKELSESDFKHFSNLRSKAMGKDGEKGAGDLNSGAMKSTLDARLRMLKVDPTPKDDGGADAARVGAIRQFVDQYFIAAQKEAGKKFTDAEVSQHIDALFAKNSTFRGFFFDSSGPMLTMQSSDIPKEARNSLRDAFKRKGNDNPTDAEILNAYWHLKTAKK